MRTRSKLLVFAALVVLCFAAPLALALHEHPTGVESHCDACHGAEPATGPGALRVLSAPALPNPAAGAAGVRTPKPPALSRHSRAPPR